MAGLLAGFLRQTAARPFVWGSFDCYWWVVAWIETARGASFSAPLRAKYRYSSARECFHIVRSLGGWDAVFAELADAAGLVPTGCPQAGDVVAFRRNDVNLLLGVRLASGRIALKTRAGLAAVRREAYAAWAL